MFIVLSLWMVINLKYLSMKKLLALSLILGSLTLGANAQTKDTKAVKSETMDAQTPAARNNSKFKGRKDGQKMHGRQDGEKMKKELGLTDAQQKQMKESRESFKIKKEAIKNDASLSETAKTEKLKALQVERKAKMATILTPDQQTKMQEMKANRKGRKSRK